MQVTVTSSEYCTIFLCREYILCKIICQDNVKFCYAKKATRPSLRALPQVEKSNNGMVSLVKRIIKA